jgi:catechol 2,3-dioxygenase-like lactoylglutathione lyase family enzyme
MSVLPAVGLPDIAARAHRRLAGEFHAKAGWYLGNCDPYRGHGACARLLRGRARVGADLSDDRLSAYAVAGHDVLLVFRKGTTGQTVVLPGGTIPGHGGDGVLHVAFAISKDELDRWEAHLASRGVDIEGRNHWERGGRSLYFRDPDGHLLELATPGLWSIY